MTEADAALEAYFRLLRAGPAQTADAATKRSRREHLLPLLRAQVSARHARRQHWLTGLRVGLGALTVGAALFAVASIWVR